VRALAQLQPGMGWLMDIADARHALGLQAVAVTAGYMHTQLRRDFYAKIDAANVDLKAFTDDFYVKLTGSHLQPVLDALLCRCLHQRQAPRVLAADREVVLTATPASGSGLS
jgi:pyruvate-formate lyase-activating enzyme